MTFSTLRLTLYTPTPYTFHCAPLTPHSTLYTLHSTLYTFHFTLHSTLYTLHTTLYTLHFTLHTLHCTHYTLHSTLFTLHSIPYTLHFTLISHRQASAPIRHLHPAPLLPSSYLKEPHSTLPAQATPFLPSNLTMCTASHAPPPRTSAAIGNLHYVGSFASQQPPNRASPQRARPSHALVLPATSHNQP